MDDSTKQLTTELSGVDAVYRDENFDSLSQVMRLLAHSTPEAAREELDAQLQIVNTVFDRLVDEHHEQVLENAVRHGQALDMYRHMSNGLRSLAVEVDEAKRSLRPRTNLPVFVSPRHCHTCSSRGASRWSAESIDDSYDDSKTYESPSS